MDVNIEVLDLTEDVKDDPYDHSLTIPDGYMSVSRTNRYLNCGESFRRSYVDKIRKPGNSNMALGRCVHGLTETTTKQLIDNGELRPLEAAMDEAGTLAAAEFSEVLGLESGDGDRFADEARNLYKIWHKVRAPELKPLSAEKRFTANLLGVKTIGYIDLIDTSNGPEVIDLKVGRKKRSDKDAVNSLQLAVYGHVEGIPGVGFDSLVRSVVPKFAKARAVVTPKAAQWAERLVRETAELISKGVFPKTSPENWWCTEKFCDHWFECRGR
jgi:RecB family exonuclease